MRIPNFRQAGLGALLALATVLGGCDTPCDADADCFGTTPVCDIQQCFCTAACTGPADCNQDGYECNAQKFCSRKGQPVVNSCK